VSGSGSKLSAVGAAPGLTFARAEPGFARVLVLRDGSLHVTLLTTSAEYLSCPAASPQREDCMRAGIAGFQVVWSERL
jgi:hypothetical protein